MSTEAAAKEISIDVNLAALVGNLRVKFQYLTDFNILAIAGTSKIEKADYEHSPFFASQQLAPDHRLPLSEARMEFSTWCLKNTFTEAIDLVSVVLEECRTIAAMYRLGPRCSGADWNRVTINKKKSFHRLPFPRKIEELRKSFGVSSKFEAHVLSLNRARNCLIHRLGSVSDEDVDTNGHLTITWHALRFVAVDSVAGEELILSRPTAVQNESALNARFGPVQKLFSKGERITFSPEEINHTMLTFYVFALELAQKLDVLQPRP